jgi:hypothetical protein
MTNDPAGPVPDKPPEGGGPGTSARTRKVREVAAVLGCKNHSSSLVPFVT